MSIGIRALHLASCSGVDPTTVAVFMEDGGAIVGLLIAGERLPQCPYNVDGCKGIMRDEGFK